MDYGPLDIRNRKRGYLKILMESITKRPYYFEVTDEQVRHNKRRGKKIDRLEIRCI